MIFVHHLEWILISCITAITKFGLLHSCLFHFMYLANRRFILYVFNFFMSELFVMFQNAFSCCINNLVASQYRASESLSVLKSLSLLIEGLLFMSIW